MLKCAAIRTRPRSRRSADGGYILITLMLFVTLLVIAATTMLPELKFQIQRDREEEMVHRGAQYSRAIRRYFKKFGTYPASLDQLESSGQNMRFLRKRYKDPITGQDFKILHLSDVKFVLGPGIRGAQNLGQPIGSAANTSTTPDPNAANGNPPTTGTDTTGTPPADSSQQSGNSGSSNSPFTTVSGQPGDPSFGGGPIVGVASVSTKDTVRIYNKKNHYNEWQFAYDPASDRGGLIVGPYQPSLQPIVADQNGMLGNQGGAGTGFIPGMMTPGTQPNVPPQPPTGTQPQP
jgi:type II secretory pathway pseudopilin PulG